MAQVRPNSCFHSSQKSYQKNVVCVTVGVPQLLALSFPCWRAGMAFQQCDDVPAARMAGSLALLKHARRRDNNRTRPQPFTSSASPLSAR